MRLQVLREVAVERRVQRIDHGPPRRLPRRGERDRPAEDDPQQHRRTHGGVVTTLDSRTPLDAGCPG